MSILDRGSDRRGDVWLYIHAAEPQRGDQAAMAALLRDARGFLDMLDQVVLEISLTIEA